MKEEVFAVLPSITVRTAISIAEKNHFEIVPNSTGI